MKFFSWISCVALAAAVGAVAPAARADRLEFVSGSPQTVAAGATLEPFVVRVLSDAGSPLPGKQVDFSNGMAPCGQYTGGTLTASAASGATGLATSPRFIAGGQAMECRLIASLQGSGDGAPGSGGVPVEFVITIQGGTVQPPAPSGSRIEVVSGTPQSAGFGVALQPFVVRVVNSSGSPLSGQHIRFVNSMPPCGTYEGGTVDVEVITNASGIATSPRFVTGSEPATCSQMASIVPAEIGGPAPVYFSITIQGTGTPVQGGNYQDMWWAGATENGWGMSVVQHSRRLFAVIYAYNSTGKAEWYVMPTGVWNASETAYSGNIYIPSGAPFHTYDSARFVPGAPVGSITITFASSGTATLDYTVRNLTGSRTIQRQVFGSQVAAPLTSLGDMWWGGTAQNGWGISVIQRDSVLFMVWFTYDDAGSATWYVMPGGNWTAADTYEGRIYRTQGPAWSPYDVSRLQVTDVGPYRLKFDAIGTAALDYSVSGRTGTLSLQKQPF